ncbi:hypothetical protein AAF712_000381 [Marasmius tenuissimus]|uniref:MYND-type domain-containing protein n=1 Tax=Marasmius tenuissimus TaxID=585030 RepID=A0ABR3AHY8_9AGAR|nr:hypothetical protein PM082_001182 [Marasmius tenuissimus]
MFDNIVINGFMFCEPHGSEYCHSCSCDHRMCNNIRIEEELAQAFPGISEEKLLDRPPLANVIKGKATRSKKKDSNGDTLYECVTHQKVDCDVCFNWGKHVVDQFQRVAKTFGKEIPVELTRDEKLGLMHTMGIELPTTTQLPDDALDKKLRNAVDAAQYFNMVVAKSSIDPVTLPAWPVKSSLQEATARGNIGEGLGRDGILRAKGKSPFPQYEGVFLEVRRTVRTIAEGVDQGTKCYLLQNEDQSGAIILRIVETRKIERDEEGVPVLLVLYGYASRETPAHDKLSWLADKMTNGVQCGQFALATEAQKLLLTFLHMNAKRLPSKYRPARGAFETQFIPSFILPIGPISQQDTGSLTKSAGCVVCGNKTTKKCSACLSVDYCSPECQRGHWQEHKPACKSLKGGRWRTVEVVTQGEYMASILGKDANGMVASSFSFQDTFQSMRGAKSTPVSEMSPASNIHGNNPFLVKIQKAMGGDAGAMLMYDRQKSFQFNLVRAKDTAAHTEALKQMSTSATGLKIYRWAKQTGDRQLSVCFDRPPPSDPLW